MKLTPHTETRTVTTTVEEVTGVTVTLPLELVLLLRSMYGSGALSVVCEHLFAAAGRNGCLGYVVTAEQRTQFATLLGSVEKLCRRAYKDHHRLGFADHDQEWGVAKLREYLNGL